MTPQQEAIFEKKAEKHFKGKRELPAKRDFRWNQARDSQAEEAYRKNFDKIFNNSPGYGV